MSVETTTSVRTHFRAAYAAKLLFMRVGVLPFFLVAALVVFTLASSQFLTAQNIVNVARQSVYLVLVSLGQMIVLLTGGFDLAVGTTIALTSVISAMIMISVMAAIPDSVGLIIAAGCLGAMAVALLIGLINGTGVAVFGVSPFIMTLGVQSVGAGVALFLTGGVPVTGFPHAFGDTFGFGRVFGVPVTGRHRNHRHRRRRGISLRDPLRPASLRCRRQCEGCEAFRHQHHGDLADRLCARAPSWLRSTDCC